MINREAIAKALVEECTPMELATRLIEAEEQREIQQHHANNLSNENYFLREWCEYMKSIVAEVVHSRKGGAEC